MKKTLILLFTSFFSYSQCAMCRAVLEANQDNDVAKGINDGITYLMVFPYILLVVIGLLIYKLYKSNQV